MNLQRPAPRSEGLPPVPRALPMIERHVAATGVETQISAVLYEAVLGAVRFGPRDLPHSADREWIRGAMAAPVQEVVRRAMQALDRMNLPPRAPSIAVAGAGAAVGAALEALLGLLQAELTAFTLAAGAFTGAVVGAIIDVARAPD